MKICYLFSNFHLADLTAEPKMALGLAQQSAKNGHEVSVIANSSKLVQKKEDGIHYFLFKGLGNIKTYLINTPKIVRYLHKIKPEILHISGGMIIVYAWLINIFLRIPLVFTLCESLDTFGGIQKWILLFCLSKIHTIFVPSEYYKKQLIQNGISKKKIVVARLGLDPRLRGDDRKKTNIDVFFFGDSGKDRGFDIVYSLAKEMKDVSFTLLIRWEKECKKELSELKKMKNVKVLYSPQKEPLTSMVQRSKLVLLPFRWMGVRPPLSIVEAMALGKCIITSTMTGNEELIGNNENGILSNFKNSKEVANQIQHLIAHPDKRERLGANARKTIQQLYSSEEVTKVLNCYALTKN